MIIRAYQLVAVYSSTVTNYDAIEEMHYFEAQKRAATAASNRDIGSGNLERGGTGTWTLRWQRS